MTAAPLAADAVTRDVLVTTELTDPAGCPHLHRTAVALGADLAAVQGPGPALGEVLTRPDLEAVRAHLDLTTSPVTGSEAPLHSPAWEEVPEHAHHLLVCRGPRCSAQGAPETAAAIGTELRRRGWGDDVVLTTQTGCLFPCNQAPVVCTYPGGRWTGPVRAADVPALLDDLDHPTQEATT